MVGARVRSNALARARGRAWSGHTFLRDEPFPTPTAAPPAARVHGHRRRTRRGPGECRRGDRRDPHLRPRLGPDPGHRVGVQHGPLHHARRPSGHDPAVHRPAWHRALVHRAGQPGRPRCRARRLQRRLDRHMPGLHRPDVRRGRSRDAAGRAHRGRLRHSQGRARAPIALAMEDSAGGAPACVGFDGTSVGRPLDFETAGQSPAADLDWQPPGDASGLRAIPGPHAITLAWTPPADALGVRYEVYADGSDQPFTQASGSSTTIQNLTPGVPHTYRIRPFRFWGGVWPSNFTASVTAAAAGFPQAWLRPPGNAAPGARPDRARPGGAHPARRPARPQAAHPARERQGLVPGARDDDAAHVRRSHRAARADVPLPARRHRRLAPLGAVAGHHGACAATLRRAGEQEVPPAGFEPAISALKGRRPDR
jgi:hypothetical protein